MSVTDGLIINNKKIGNFENPTIKASEEIRINGWSGNYSSEVGMVKIDDVLIIPTPDGMLNTTTNELLQISQGYGATFTYIEDYKVPTFDGNLIRTVNVNIVPKINIRETGIRLANSRFFEVPEWIDWSGITDMQYMFQSCLKLTTIPEIDTSKVTDMSYMFSYCGLLTSIPEIDTSKVTDMSYMFRDCKSLTTIPQLNTTNVASMYYLFDGCTKLKSVPPLYAGNLTYSLTYYGIFGSSVMTALTDFGGLIDLKYRMNGNYSFQKCPNLTYQSCINILNGLYDFTGNGETPTSSQGQLKVHSNFLTLVGDEISIGTNKGWTITT